MPRRTQITDSSSTARVRTALACNQCRKRKSKCGGEQPCCLMCETAGRDCTYDHNTRKRGLQSGYVRSLEIVLGLVFHHLPRNDSHIHGILRTQSHKNLFLEGASKGESFVSRWRKSGVARDLEQLLQPATLESSGNLEQQTQESSTSALDFMDTEVASPADSGGLEIPQIPSAHNAIDQNGPGWFATESFRDNILIMDLPPQTVDLVDSYLEHTQPWFPVVERSDILRSIHTSISARTRNDNHDVGMRLCLWAIIAYEMLNESFRDINLHPKDIQIGVRMAILKNDQMFELGHIQALMILALMQIASDQLEMAWILSAQASRMAMTYAKRGTIDRKKFSCTIRGSILVDVLLSSVLDQPTCWSDKALLSFDSSTDTDSIEEWQTWKLNTDAVSGTPIGRRQPLRALSIFGYTTEMIQRLNRSLRTTQNGDSRMNFLRDHQTWKERLPQFCKLQTGISCTPPLLLLHLTWHFSVYSLANEPESLSAQVVQQVAESIDSMALQSAQKLHRVRQLTLEQEQTCHQLLQNLRNVWQTDGFAYSNTVHQGTPPSLIPPQSRFVNDEGFSEARQSEYMSSTDQTMDSTLTLAQIGDSHERLEVADLSLQIELGNAEETMDTVNDFDTYVFEMSLAPPTRDSEQARLLSQNLGFLDETFINEYPDIF